MKQRLESLRRVLDVQRQLHRAAEWQLARLRLEESAVLEEQRQIVNALNEDGKLHGLFVETMARHLRRTSTALAAIGKAKAEQGARLRDQTGRLKRAERIHERAAGEYRRAVESKELLELVEAAAGRAQASRKLGLR